MRRSKRADAEDDKRAYRRALVPACSKVAAGHLGLGGIGLRFNAKAITVSPAAFTGAQAAAEIHRVGNQDGISQLKPIADLIQLRGITGQEIICCRMQRFPSVRSLRDRP